MTYYRVIAYILISILWVPSSLLWAQSRLKDIVSVQGVRDNHLVGYGLVVGLDGTGDDLTKAVFTQESIIGMLDRLGVNANIDGLDVDNVAAVVVTADLPAFAQSGERIDITVSAMGDADSLVGGTLLVTPLLGADGEVYAVGQGSVLVEGYDANGLSDTPEGGTVTTNVPTSGRIPNGAIVEAEINFDFRNLTNFNLHLRTPDFTTSRRIAGAINALLGIETAYVVSPGLVSVQVPEGYLGGSIGLATDIEHLRVQVDMAAQVVINESSGLIVMGNDVRINEVAISHAGLSVEVNNFEAEDNTILPVNEEIFGANVNDVVEEEQPGVDQQNEGKSNFGVLRTGIVLNDLVRGFNALGVKPRDMINILEAIKASGALQAEIKIL